MSNVFKALQDELLAKAIKNVDIDALSIKVAKSLEKSIVSDMDNFLENDFNIYEWLSEILMNERTTAGKQFKKAINQMAEKMANSLIK